MAFRDDMAKATLETFERLGGLGVYDDGLNPPVEDRHVILDLGVAIAGDFGKIVGSKDMMRTLKAEIPNAVVGQLITVTEGTFALVFKEYTDGFYERWVVKKNG